MEHDGMTEDQRAIATLMAVWNIIVILSGGVVR
jgi:hypothetical protein